MAPAQFIIVAQNQPCYFSEVNRITVAGVRSPFCCTHKHSSSAKCISVLVQCSGQLSGDPAPQHSPGGGQAVCDHHHENMHSRGVHS